MRSVLGAALTLTLVLTSAACSTSGESSGGREGGGGVNDDPYIDEDKPYPYSNEAQEQVVDAFLDCMEGHGAPLRGPYLPHRGRGMVFKHAKEVPEDVRREAGDACPQLLLAVFLGGANADADYPTFRKASIEFSSCMRASGYPSFPKPDFRHHNPYPNLVSIDIEYNSKAFARAVNECRDPLEDVFFS